MPIRTQHRIFNLASHYQSLLESMAAVPIAHATQSADLVDGMHKFVRTLLGITLALVGPLDGTGHDCGIQFYQEIQGMISVAELLEEWKMVNMEEADDWVEG
jgi:hypothetical protein